MNYGIAINTLRLQYKENQSTFAENIGVTQSYLSLVENGKQKPSLDLLEKISSYLEIPLPILFWNSISEEDVKPDKIESFKMLKPTVDTMIKSFF